MIEDLFLFSTAYTICFCNFSYKEITISGTASSLVFKKWHLKICTLIIKRYERLYFEGTWVFLITFATQFFFLFKINHLVLYDMPKLVGNKNILVGTKIPFSQFICWVYSYLINIWQMSWQSHDLHHDQTKHPTEKFISQILSKIH